MYDHSKSTGAPLSGQRSNQRINQVKTIEKIFTIPHSDSLE